MSALTLIADIQGPAQNYIFRIWLDVRFQGQSGHPAAPEVQHRVYGKQFFSVQVAGGNFWWPMLSSRCSFTSFEGIE